MRAFDARKGHPGQRCSARRRSLAYIDRQSAAAPETNSMPSNITWTRPTTNTSSKPSATLPAIKPRPAWNRVKVGVLDRFQRAARRSRHDRSVQRRSGKRENKSQPTDRRAPTARAEARDRRRREGKLTWKARRWPMLVPTGSHGGMATARTRRAARARKRAARPRVVECTTAPPRSEGADGPRPGERACRYLLSGGDCANDHADAGPQTLLQIGLLFGGLTRERIRQLEAQALRKLARLGRDGRPRPERTVAAQSMNMQMHVDTCILHVTRSSVCLARAWIDGRLIHSRSALRRPRQRRALLGRRRSAGACRPDCRRGSGRRAGRT